MRLISSFTIHTLRNGFHIVYMYCTSLSKQKKISAKFLEVSPLTDSYTDLYYITQSCSIIICTTDYNFPICNWWHMARFQSRDITSSHPADVHLGTNFKYIVYKTPYSGFA